MPIDQNRLSRGLLGMFDDDRDVVDRFSMLPIGQHEDGSLTLAWPGFLKDAWEGAQRSLVAQEGKPIFDDGGQYVSGANMMPLDAFNAASIGPMSGIAGRAAGAIPKGALGSGGSEAITKLSEQPTATRAYHWSPDAADIGPDSKFNPFSHFGSREAAEDRYKVMYGEREAGATMPVDLDISNPLRIVDVGDHTPVRIASAVDYAMDPKSLDSWGSSPLVRQVANSNPFEAARLVDDAIKARGYDGLVYRNHSEDKGSDSFIATRPGSVRSAYTGETLYANPSEASLPSLLEFANYGQPQDAQQPGPLLPPFRDDPFDRANDPFNEVPMMMEYPFGLPPLGTPPEPPAIPNQQRPRHRYFTPRG
jgi:hypothetical protein